MGDSDLIEVEVIYATLESQELRKTQVPEGSDIKACVVASGVLSEYLELDLGDMKVGVFSQAKTLDYVVRAGDRIEIYRPLIADPKAVRRKKAEADKAAKGH